MKNITTRVVLLVSGLSLLGGVGVAQTATPAPRAAGHWEGKVAIPERELGISVDLAQNAKGTWIGSMSVTGTSAVDVPLNTVAVSDTGVRFTADLPDNASFDGQFSSDGSSVSGTAANFRGEAPFSLMRNGDARVKVPPPSTALSKDFEGAWEGTLNVGEKVLRLGLKLAPVTGGTATGTLVSIDQGNKEIPVTTVTIKEKELQLDSRAISGTYHGTLGANLEIAGEWTQGPKSLPLTFKRVAAETQKP